MAGAKDKKDELTPPAPPPVAESTDKPPEGYTAEEWQGLSNTEKEGIRESIDNPNDPAIGEGKEGDETPDLDEKVLAAIAEEGKEKPPEKPVEKPPEKPPEGVKPPEGTPPAEKAPTTPPGEVVIPTDDELLRFRAVVPASELKVEPVVPSEIKAKLDALDEKYDAGDIELKAYNQERDALNRQVNEVLMEAREELRNQKIWAKEQAAFFAARPEYMEKEADGTFTLKSSAMYGAFKESISRLGTNQKYSNAPGMELLLAADRAVKNAFGVPAKPPVTPAKTEVGETPEKGKEKKPPAPLPDGKTLGDLPAAAGNTTDDWRAALDNLPGDKLEAALERMTEEQKARYLDGR